MTEPLSEIRSLRSVSLSLMYATAGHPTQGIIHVSDPIQVLTFDCYGTLIDWESGMIEALKPLTDRVDSKKSRNEILEAHARHESSQQVQTPTKLYRDLLPIVYKRLAEEWGVSVTHEECVAYGRSVRDWPAFDDSA